tara:strand:+ start:117 stop:473 length:357 start_codon:yes stop_codon:yes gene_type:complete
MLDKAPITLTNSAITYLKNTAINSGKDYVWFGVEGGGCSGFNYKWAFVDDPDPDDFKISLGSTANPNHRELFLIIDLISEMHVMGSEIDYVQELGGSFLKVNNPIAASSCGCGESFSV